MILRHAGGFFDRLLYVDWDLLESGDLLQILDRKFQATNERLVEFVPRAEIPTEYLPPHAGEMRRQFRSSDEWSHAN